MPANQRDFLAYQAEEYGKLKGDPLKVAKEQRGLTTEEALHAFLLELVEVRLRHATGQNEYVKATVATILQTSPCHLLSYLLDYFLCQLQVGDWYMAPPYQTSPKIAIQWNDGDQLVTVKTKLLRNGCLGTVQFLVWTQTEHHKRKL